MQSRVQDPPAISTYVKHPDVHPDSQDFVSTTLPTKRSQGSLESNQIHISQQKNQNGPGTLRHHQEAWVLSKMVRRGQTSQLKGLLNDEEMSS